MVCPNRNTRKEKKKEVAYSILEYTLTNQSLQNTCKTNLDLISASKSGEYELDWQAFKSIPKDWKPRDYSTPPVAVRLCFKDHLWIKMKIVFNSDFQETRLFLVLISRLYSKFWFLKPDSSYETICRVQTNLEHSLQRNKIPLIDKWINL